MISRHTYTTLNIRQKIIKAAHVVRTAESARTNPGLQVHQKSPDEITAFLKFLRQENHPKLKKAASILQTALETLTDEKEISRQTRALNFCRHDLLALNGTEEDEQYYLADGDLFDPADRTIEPARFENAAILDNLRSPFNVGSVFRSADCFGTGELALCGITPRPPHPKLERTAMGTVSWVPWKYFKTTAEAVTDYKKNGYHVAAVERSSLSVSLPQADFPENTVFIFGNEEFGITEDVLRTADCIVEIPRMGRKNSMNVAGAFAVVMFHYMTLRKSSR